MKHIYTLILGTLFFGEMGPAQAVTPVTMQEEQGTQWVQKCMDQYPEILWLANRDVRKTEEGQEAKGSYSEQLFQEKFIEFDRTLLTLHCLKLILDGREAAYKEFVSAQPESDRLSRASFQELHRQGKDLLLHNPWGLSDVEMRQAMEASLVLGDMGKSEKARALFKVYGVKAPDHDDFHEEAMQVLKSHPDLCPTFASLPEVAQQLLIKTANLAHYGHITHLEGGLSMFSKLKESQLGVQDLNALRFDLFVHTCDVAGALGHLHSRSSMMYTEPTYRAIQATHEACLLFQDPEKTEWDAYQSYLAVRAQWLGLDPDDQIERVLTRIGTMMRLYSPAEGSLLKEAVASLNEGQKAKIVEQLDIQKGKKENRTPTYMPAVLVNLLNQSQLGDTREERLKQTVLLGLPFLSQVLQRQEERLIAKQADAQIPLNFNPIAGLVKKNPKALQNADFEIDADGKVLLKE